MKTRIDFGPLTPKRDSNDGNAVAKPFLERDISLAEVQGKSMFRNILCPSRKRGRLMNTTQENQGLNRSVAKSGDFIDDTMLAS
jgi:hypothetical protein